MKTATAELCATPDKREVRTGELSPTLYTSLRRIAWRHLGLQRKNHTLQPTALVHEAYLKLASLRDRAFSDEVHFLAVASRAMRQVLVDYARSKATLKRGVECADIDIAAVEGGRTPDLLRLIDLDDALNSLASENGRIAQLIEMCYFGGMTAEECAKALGVSVHVARHDLRFGQAWLRRKLR